MLKFDENLIRIDFDENCKETEPDSKLLEIMLELKSDVQKIIQRSKDHYNDDGKININIYFLH